MIKISDAELEIMKVIWRRKKTTSTEIIKDLKDMNWTVNTTRTLIKRLLLKGAIEIVKREGKTYTYKAIVDESDYKVDVVDKLLKKMYHGSFEEFILQYCENGKLTIEEMKKLALQIDELADNKEKNK